MQRFDEAAFSRRGFLAGAGGGLAMSSGLVLPGGPALAQGPIGSAGAAATQDAPRAVGRPQPRMEKEMPEPPGRRLGYAIVGLGKFALNQIIPAFAEAKHAKLAALVSGDRAKADKVAQVYGVDPGAIYDYGTFDRIADNRAVDIVYVITPNALHPEFTLRAFAAGKHVLCEKPMAPTAADCERMIAAGRQAGRKLMIAYRAQYEPFNLEAMRLARAGDLGTIRYVTSDHGRPLDPKDPADQWRMVKSLAGGGSLYDIGIYSLQAARYMTGEEPIEVQAFISSPEGDPRFREVEDLCAFQLRFPSGALASLSSSYSTASVKRFQVFGSKASLVLDPATEYYKHELVLKTEKEERKPEIEEGNQFALQMDHFAQAVMENREPKTPGEEGLRDVRIMQAVYQAAATGRPVGLDATGSLKR
ncbi:MAG TPA: Gfo/Idh/MocA family oxidoreductase [Beijerinckiaceae bacterium]|jgi:predicted dehydrogenase